MTARKSGILVLAIHLALVGMVLVRYVIDLETLPRAWSEVKWDVMPEGRYLTLRACPVFPAGQGGFASAVRLRAVNGFLVADAGRPADRVKLSWQQGNKQCLQEPSYWHLPGNLAVPAAGTGLWAEYSIPVNDWPRPLRLGTKRNGQIQPLTR